MRRPTQPVAVDAATNVVPHNTASGGYDIRRKNPDGSQVVISKQPLPDGTTRVSGFKQTEDARTGTSTRTYADGRTVIKGRDFERRTVPSGLGFVSHQNGLREATLPDGRPAFRDQFAAVRDQDGRQRQVIERTRYAHWAQGRPAFEAQPVVRHYDVGHIHGAPVAQYRPSRFSSDTYRGFASRFAAPVLVAGAATAAWVAFGNPTTTYEDPVALIGDMQITSGFEEGYTQALPIATDTPYVNPDAGDVRNQMTAMQQQVSSAVKSNATLTQQLGGVDIQATSTQVQQAVGSAVPVQISEDVRLQVRKQVRLAVALHQSGQALSLNDVLAGGYAKVYLFQTAQPVNVPDLSAGGECFLNTGDLVAFAKLPAADAQAAEMKVVASAANSCRPEEHVEVRLTDIQEMLNGFSERVEDNMKRVSTCAASGRC